MAHAFGVISKNSLLKPRSLRFFPVFSSKSVLVLALTFRSMIHFELTMQGKGLSTFFSQHTDCYSLICWRENPFSIELPRHLYRKSIDLGTSLVAQWLRLHAPNAGARVWLLVRELYPTCMPQLRVCMPQLRIRWAATKTQCNQINK